VAVRSSALAEDTEQASFAGQYETFLDVCGADDVVAAVQRCFASAFSARVMTYGSSRASLATHGAGMAVLVQRMVAPTAAGVAFTAHPVTGERGVVTISAVPGLGELLVSGQADAEEWEVRGGEVTRRRSVTPTLDVPMARAVAELARAVEREAGTPQDVEWAVGGGDVHLLQARPMTVVPEPVRWEAPRPGAWVRNFRLGEWIGDPVSPLFESWCLSRIEMHFADELERICGYRPATPSHVVVNGWYFYGLDVPDTGKLLRNLPRVLWRTFRNFRRVAAITPPLAHLGFDHEYRRWRDDLLPTYRQAVHEAARTVDTADEQALLVIVDDLLADVGDQFVSITGVAGYAAKTEGPLFAFWKAHLSNIEGSSLDLVHGVEEVRIEGHAVQGLDWYLPTLGESSLEAAPLDPEARARLASGRDAVLGSAHAALRSQPKLLKKFDDLLATARRAHAARQEQTGAFTLAWPVLRTAITRLGHLLAARGVLARPDDVFFLRHDELVAICARPAAQPAAADIAGRKAVWTRQRSLAPPLLLGELAGMWKQVFAMIDGLLDRQAPPADGELRGYPGSPGRVTGKARILRRVDELDRLQPGEILVAPVTTPGWTPAFTRARAVVTDTGSLASHASVVAREYGIPAVVATGDATARLYDGQVITVDGSRGVVLTAPGSS
jgi:pyruvate,water dikinase